MRNHKPAFETYDEEIISSNYKSLSENNAVLESPVFPERGFVYDRNNKVLVANQPGYDLMVIPESTTKFDTLELSSLLNLSIERFNLKIRKATTSTRKATNSIRKAHKYIKTWIY